MPEVPDVSAIAQQVKVRIKHIQEQLKQHEKLTTELERLRDALTRLEGAARSRVRGNRRPPATKPARPTRATAGTRSPAGTRADAQGREKPNVLLPRRARKLRVAPRVVRTRPRCLRR